MKLFIPEIGTVITLAEDWTFTIINESRNRGLAVLMGIKDADYYLPFGSKESDEIESYRYYGQRRVPIDPGTYTIKAGTNLEVDRIYIRKGNEEFSSVTFKMRVKSKVVRFFARLEDVNKIEF